MVEQAYPRLQKVAIPHTWVSFTPGYLPRLYTWDAYRRHAGTFAFLSSHY